jgi:hypothetical protein
LHHVLQAAFDALGDFDFAGAREQLACTHFTHIHADRVGRAAEFGVNRGQRDFRFLIGLIVRCGSRRAVVQKQRFRVGRRFVHGHAHFAERADDGFHRGCFGEIVGQVVVDVGVRQIAAFAAQRDQRAHLTLTFFNEGFQQGRI